MLAALLSGALWMGWRLNRRLKVLREGQMGFAKAVADLYAAASPSHADARLQASIVLKPLSGPLMRGPQVIRPDQLEAEA